ncbi:MAG: ruvC [Patescibacteria group bacterium]|nr:ruvC [Patescibacteria group bacterium]
MKILGIDPGYERCGIAIIEKQNRSKETVVFSTCLRTSSKDEFSKRLASIGSELEAIIAEHKPDTAAIEELYFGKSSTTGLKVAEVRGVIRYVLEKNSIPCTEYHPSAIKIAITGYGSAKKEDIAFMIPKLVQCENAKKLDDELDAIAVAITHGTNANRRALTG